jgi:hypothetical protein
MSDFELMTEDDECRSCGQTGDRVPLRSIHLVNTDAPSLLCHLCAGTFAGNAISYPKHFTDGGATMRSVSFVGNEILLAIGDLRRDLAMVMEHQRQLLHMEPVKHED